MYESRTYDDEYGEPVIVLVVTGQHDVSRLIHTFTGAPIVVEQLTVGDKLVRQLKRHNRGRAALALLAQHGGADFTEPGDETEGCEWATRTPDGTRTRWHGEDFAREAVRQNPHLKLDRREIRHFVGLWREARDG